MPKSTKLVISIVVIFVIVFFVVTLFQNLFPSVSTILLHRSSQLGQTNGRTNILLLGIGGGTHDGPNLTDTIIFASIDTSNKKVNLISIPRDLWISNLYNNYAAKINEAYADGQLSNNKGLLLAKSTVENVLGQPIHYSVRIDFNGFVKAVDLLGGLDVNVQNTLDDYQYPIEGKEDDPCGKSPDDIQAYTNSLGTATAASELDFFPCRFMHLHVSKGLQHMDGTLALEFVRSRHAADEEGSDFARSRRQQLVIEAIRSKLFSLGFLFNPGKLVGMYNIIKDSIDTDIPQEDFIPFIQMMQKFKDSKIETAVIDYGDSATNRAGLLIQPPISSVYNFAYVLIPRIGQDNFSEIKQYVSCELQKGNCVVGQTPNPTFTK